MQVKSSGYAAEFGGATGGVINVITRSGTNAFSGEFGTYFSGSDLNGKARPTLRLVSATNDFEYKTFDKDDQKVSEPFMNVGGPVIRDRAWFFGGYTPQISETSRTVTFTSNGSTGTFEMPERTHFFTANATAAITPQLRGRFSSNIQRYSRDNVLPAIDGSSSPTANFNIDREQPNDYMRGLLEFTANNNLFLSGAVNWLRYDTNETGVPTDVQYIFQEATPPGTPPDLARARNFQNITSNRAVVRDMFERLGGQADATLFFNRGGSHTLKGGMQFYRITNDVFNAEQAPRIILRWGQAHTLLDGRIINGQLGTYSWRQFGTQGIVKVNNIGLFIQDDWTINKRLTLNLGVRTEADEAALRAARVTAKVTQYGSLFGKR